MVNPVWFIGSPQSIGYMLTNLKQLGQVTPYGSDSELGASGENKQHVLSGGTVRDDGCQ